MRAAGVLGRAVLHTDLVEAIHRRVIEAQVREGRRKCIKEALHRIARRLAHRVPCG